MNHKQSTAIALASVGCSRCDGLGIIKSKAAGDEMDGATCRCVNIATFRDCHNRFKACADKPRHLSQPTMMRSHGANAIRSWGRKNEEFIADFVLIAARVLCRGTKEHQLFTFRYLLGADIALVQRRMRITPAEYGRMDAHVIQVLGRAFRETEPYSLYPIDEYFSSGNRRDETPADRVTAPATRTSEPVRPPLAQAASPVPQAA